MERHNFMLHNHCFCAALYPYFLFSVIDGDCLSSFFVYLTVQCLANRIPDLKLRGSLEVIQISPLSFIEEQAEVSSDTMYQDYTESKEQSRDVNPGSLTSNLVSFLLYCAKQLLVDHMPKEFVFFNNQVSKKNSKTKCSNPTLEAQ